MLDSDRVELKENEDSAVFLALNHVDILKIKGLEFYHTYLIVLTRYPNCLPKTLERRIELFYDTETRNQEASDVVYFDSYIMHERPIWETTISASSECAYDTSSHKLGKLIKVPNFDRKDNIKSGKRVFVKKLLTNDSEVIEKLLTFESLYTNSVPYALLPEATKDGYNSNSFTRGALEYAGLMDNVQFTQCFRLPGLSKPLIVENIPQ